MSVYSQTLESMYGLFSKSRVTLPELFKPILSGRLAAEAEFPLAPVNEFDIVSLVSPTPGAIVPVDVAPVPLIDE